MQRKSINETNELPNDDYNNFQPSFRRNRTSEPPPFTSTLAASGFSSMKRVSQPVIPTFLKNKPSQIENRTRSSKSVSLEKPIINELDDEVEDIIDFSHDSFDESSDVNISYPKSFRSSEPVLPTFLLPATSKIKRTSEAAIHFSPQKEDKNADLQQTLKSKNENNTIAQKKFQSEESINKNLKGLEDLHKKHVVKKKEGANGLLKRPFSMIKIVKKSNSSERINEIPPIIQLAPTSLMEKKAFSEIPLNSAKRTNNFKLDRKSYSESPLMKKNSLTLNDQEKEKANIGLQLLAKVLHNGAEPIFMRSKVNEKESRTSSIIINYQNESYDDDIFQFDLDNSGDDFDLPNFKPELSSVLSSEPMKLKDKPTILDSSLRNKYNYNESIEITISKSSLSRMIKELICEEGELKFSKVEYGILLDTLISLLPLFATPEEVLDIIYKRILDERRYSIDRIIHFLKTWITKPWGSDDLLPNLHSVDSILQNLSSIIRSSRREEKEKNLYGIKDLIRSLIAMQPNELNNIISKYLDMSFLYLKGANVDVEPFNKGEGALAIELSKISFEMYHSINIRNLACKPKKRCKYQYVDYDRDIIKQYTIYYESIGIWTIMEIFRNPIIKSMHAYVDMCVKLIEVSKFLYDLFDYFTMWAIVTDSVNFSLIRIIELKMVLQRCPYLFSYIEEKYSDIYAKFSYLVKVISENEVYKEDLKLRLKGRGHVPPPALTFKQIEINLLSLENAPKINNEIDFGAYTNIFHISEEYLSGQNYKEVSFENSSPSSPNYIQLVQSSSPRRLSRRLSTATSTALNPTKGYITYLADEKFRITILKSFKIAREEKFKGVGEILREFPIYKTEEKFPVYFESQKLFMMRVIEEKKRF